ncbi:MAG: hypothetical protein RLZZ499_320 [Cyanobacteriota bacterium]
MIIHSSRKSQISHDSYVYADVKLALGGIDYLLTDRNYVYFFCGLNDVDDAEKILLTSFPQLIIIQNPEFALWLQKKIDR